MRYHPAAPLLAALTLLLAAAAARACDVPVFRYALERWQPETYDLIVFHNGKLPDHHAANLAALRKFSSEDRSGYANITVTDADLADPAKLPDDVKALWDAQKNPALPHLVVRLADFGDKAPPVYAGPLTADAVQSTIDSPARRTLAQRLLAGDSAVWLLLESGDQAKDKQAFDLLTTQLKFAQDNLKLPEIDKDDPTPANQLRSTVPLKIAFSILRVSRTDPKESFLVANLLASEDELPKNEPIAFAVIGRARSLPALAGKYLTDKNILAACEFIVGRCSCEVKRENPGFDLLVSADWDAPLQNRLVKDPPFPELVGLTPTAATEPATLASYGKTSSGTITLTGVSYTASTGSTTLPLVIGGTLAALIIAAGTGAAFLLFRKPRP